MISEFSFLVLDKSLFTSSVEMNRAFKWENSLSVISLMRMASSSLGPKKTSGGFGLTSGFKALVSLKEESYFR